VQVGAVQRPAEHPVDARVVGVEEGLRGHAVRDHPHAQEEEEEEHVLHLERRTFLFYGGGGLKGTGAKTQITCSF